MSRSKIMSEESLLSASDEVASQDAHYDRLAELVGEQELPEDF